MVVFMDVRIGKMVHMRRQSGGDGEGQSSMCFGLWGCGFLRDMHVCFGLWGRVCICVSINTLMHN